MNKFPSDVTSLLEFTVEWPIPKGDLEILSYNAR
jgi:hypothetical protein